MIAPFNQLGAVRRCASDGTQRRHPLPALDPTAAINDQEMLLACSQNLPSPALTSKLLVTYGACVQALQVACKTADQPVGLCERSVGYGQLAGGFAPEVRLRCLRSFRRPAGSRLSCLRPPDFPIVAHSAFPLWIFTWTRFRSSLEIEGGRDATALECSKKWRQPRFTQCWRWRNTFYFWIWSACAIHRRRAGESDPGNRCHQWLESAEHQFPGCAWRVSALQPPSGWRAQQHEPRGIWCRLVK